MKRHSTPVGRSLALNATTITAYDEECIYYGPDRYESPPATARLLRKLVKQGARRSK